jgi:multiple sugar transport system permease protein
MADTSHAKPLSYRLMGHSALVILSVVFVIPFLWLLSTSFKADDDLMEDPTSLTVLIPKGRFATVNGNMRRVVVSKFTIDEPSLIVRWEEGPDKGKTKLVGTSEIKDGKLERWTNLDAKPVRNMFGVSVVKEIPASNESPWKRVEEYSGSLSHAGAKQWDCVPEKEIQVRFCPVISNYIEGLKSRNFARFFLTTALITISAVFVTVLSCSFTAYGFSILQWKGRDTIFFLMLCTMMLPRQVTLIPKFILFKHLGWINTFRPLVVPLLFGTGFFIFILRQFYRSIPRSLIDAARIDGCSELRIWWQMIMPLSKPALMTIGLFSFLQMWNNFMGPLVYLTSEKKYTLSLALAMFQGEYGTEYGMLMAMTVLTIGPILILFFFAQKTFIQGIKLTGTKG